MALLLPEYKDACLRHKLQQDMPRILDALKVNSYTHTQEVCARLFFHETKQN